MRTDEIERWTLALGHVGALLGVGFSIGIRWCSDYIRKLEAEVGEMLPAT